MQTNGNCRVRDFEAASKLFLLYRICIPQAYEDSLGLLEMTTHTVWFDSVEKEEQNKLFKKTLNLLNKYY